MMAHPRLIVVTNAPVSPGARAAQRNASAFAPTDDGAANALGALITRTFTSGSIAQRGDANGWTLGGESGPTRLRVRASMCGDT